MQAYSLLHVGRSPCSKAGRWAGTACRSSCSCMNESDNDTTAAAMVRHNQQCLHTHIKALVYKNGARNPPWLLQPTHEACFKGVASGKVSRTHRTPHPCITLTLCHRGR